MQMLPKLTKAQQRENIAVAYSIIGGIPNKYFSLSTFSSTNNIDAVEAAECGTIGCSLGWLARHPYFIEQGLVIRNRVPVLQTSGPIRFNESTHQAAAHLFGHDAYYLYFAGYGFGRKDNKITRSITRNTKKERATHRELALARLKDGYYDPKYTKK